MSPNGRSLRRLIGVLASALLAGCSSLSAPDLASLHATTVLVQHAKGHGTGAIIGPNAVLTAFHVVEDQPLEVTFFDGQAAPGRIGWQDPVLDLAVIQVDVPDGYPAPELYCGELQAGQHLMLVGHPTHSRWVAVGGYLPAATPFEGDLVQLGFPIGLGTSGGPVFDHDGRIVGIALAILAERSSASANFGDFKDTGIGLMLPARLFCSDLDTD